MTVPLGEAEHGARISPIAILRCYGSYIDYHSVSLLCCPLERGNALLTNHHSTPSTSVPTLSVSYSLKPLLAYIMDVDVIWRHLLSMQAGNFNRTKNSRFKYYQHACALIWDCPTTCVFLVQATDRYSHKRLNRLHTCTTLDRKWAYSATSIYSTTYGDITYTILNCNCPCEQKE